MLRLILDQILGQCLGECVRVGPVLAQLLAHRVQHVLVHVVVQVHGHRSSNRHLVELLLHLGPIAVGVRRGHVHKGRQILDLVAEIDHRLRAQQVDAHGHGHLLVEAHGGGHVEDHIDAFPQQRLVIVGHAQVALAAVARNGVDLVPELGLLRLEPIEQAVLEDCVDPGLHIFALLVPHEHVDRLEAGTGAQQFVDDDCGVDEEEAKWSNKNNNNVN